MALTPDPFGPLMETVLECARARLAETDAGEPALVHLVPGGLPAWDNCCEHGGQLYVRLARVFPTMGGDGRSPFPNPDNTQPCGVTMLAAELAVGVIRCVHTLDGNGRAPTAAQMTADALTMTADASALLDALRCCTAFTGSYRNRIGLWTPQGAQGGCGGGEWAFTVALPVCACPEEE